MSGIDQRSDSIFCPLKQSILGEFQTWQMPGSSGGMSLAASEQSEQTRKVLRYVAEAVRRIEERHQAANKVEGVFTLELLTLRFD